jgi:hypothetical protein
MPAPSKRIADRLARQQRVISAALTPDYFPLPRLYKGRLAIYKIDYDDTAYLKIASSNGTLKLESITPVNGLYKIHTDLYRCQHANGHKYLASVAPL